MNYFRLSKWLLYLPVIFGTVIVSRSTLFPFIVGKYVFFRTIVGISAILFLLGLLFEEQKGSFFLNRMKILFKNPLFRAIGLFVFIFLLACIFGVNPSFSFWSNFERGEGGLQMISFFLYFFLLSVLFEKKEEWKILINCAIFGGVLMGVYGFLASMGVEGFIGPRFSDAAYRFHGSIGNPAYVAIYSLFLMFYCFYFILSEKQTKISPRIIGYSILAIFFALIFFLAATRGTFLGLGISLITALLYIGFVYKQFRKKMIALILSIVIIIGTLIYFKDTPFIKKIPGSRIFDISFSTKTFQDRTIIWKIAWDGFLERPLFGWGPENFIKVFDKHFNINYFKPDEGFGAWFDRAHSIIFDYLAETGIFGFVSYMGIFVIYYITFFKSSLRKNEKILHSIILHSLFFALPLAYLIQGLVLFDVSITYLNLFLFFAFSIFIFSPISLVIDDKNHQNKKKKNYI